MTPSRPSLEVEGFFDKATSSVSYLVRDASTNQCAIIDSVLDFDAASGRARTEGADRLVARVHELGASVQWILETHIHADHLSAASYLRERLGGRLAIGEHIQAVQRVFGALFNADETFARDGSQFDHLFADGETFRIGGLEARVLHTPGHTPACLTYVVGDATQACAFVGDTLFMPDYGTARCDFPGGDAATLYRSIARVLGLPPDTRLYLCHDYPPRGREVCFETTVAAQRERNVHVHAGVGEAEFVAMRQARDATLAMPALLFAAVQVNMRAGEFPPPESNGVRYLRTPVGGIPRKAAP